jgi:hypothetical protein
MTTASLSATGQWRQSDPPMRIQGQRLDARRQFRYGLILAEGATVFPGSSRSTLRVSLLIF